MGQGIMKTIIAETMHFRVGLQLVKDLFVRSVVFIQMVTQAIVFILTGAMFELQMMEQGTGRSGKTQLPVEYQTEPDLSAPDGSDMVISNFEMSSFWAKWCISFQRRVGCQQFDETRLSKLKQKKVMQIMKLGEDHYMKSNGIPSECQYFHNKLQVDSGSAGHCNPFGGNCKEQVIGAVLQRENIMEIAFVRAINPDKEYDTDATVNCEKPGKMPYSLMHVYRENAHGDLSPEPATDESFDSNDGGDGHANIISFAFMEVSSEHSDSTPQADLDSYSDSDMDEITSNEGEDISFEYEDSCDDNDHEFDIIFDEEFNQEEEIQGNDTTSLPLYLQSCSSAHLFQSINSSFEELSDICCDKILPCITKERISLKATDYLGDSVPTVYGNNAVINVKQCKEEESKVDWDSQGNEANTDLLPTSSQIPIKPCKKKVSFANDKELKTIHLMFKWSYAYRQARKGCWERYACDRFHFQRRIASCAEVLNPVIDRKYQQFVISLN